MEGRLHLVRASFTLITIADELALEVDFRFVAFDFGDQAVTEFLVKDALALGDWP